MNFDSLPPVVVRRRPIHWPSEPLLLPESQPWSWFCRHCPACGGHQNYDEAIATATRHADHGTMHARGQQS